MKVTFIGVGAIGLPMALQVQRTGHEVTRVDVSDSVIAKAKAAGIATVNEGVRRRFGTDYVSTREGRDERLSMATHSAVSTPSRCRAS
jgi:3-hydroxyisobutyrate dehydrogenase-like beta-hydroxyacid dehydrogenase